MEPNAIQASARRRVSALILVLVALAAAGGYAYWFFRVYENDAAKHARARTELSRIARAVVRFETGEGRACANLKDLLGRYLPQATRERSPLKDPWGRAYRIDRELAFVYSAGPDGKHPARRNDAWNDDAVAELEPAPLKLVGATLELARGGDAGGQPAEGSSVLRLAFNKPVFLRREEMPLGVSAGAEKLKIDHPAGRDCDVDASKLVRFYDGVPLAFHPKWSPFPDGTVLRLLPGENPREVRAVFPADFDATSLDQLGLALTGSTRTPNPIFRGVDDALGYSDTDEPVEITLRAAGETPADAPTVAGDAAPPLR